MRLFFPVYWDQPHLWPSHNIFLHLDLSQASSLQSPFSLISFLNTSLHLFLGLPFTPLPSTCCSVSILFDVVLCHTLPIFTGLGQCPIVNWDFAGAVSIFWTGCPSCHPPMTSTRIGAHGLSIESRSS